MFLKLRLVCMKFSWKTISKRNTNLSIIHLISRAFSLRNRKPVPLTRCHQSLEEEKHSISQKSKHAIEDFSLFRLQGAA